MSIESGPYLVCDGLGEVVSFYEDGIERGDRPRSGAASTLYDLGDHREDGRGVTSTRGKLPPGQAHFSAGTRQPGETVYQE